MSVTIPAVQITPQLVERLIGRQDPSDSTGWPPGWNVARRKASHGHRNNENAGVGWTAKSLTPRPEGGETSPVLRSRFILLGASNVAIAFPRLLEALRGRAGERVEVMGAFGHGRSYGLPSRVLGRELPGIRECDLWAALEALPRAPSRAILTDVGNDLLFGASVATLVGWVEECLDRLAAAGARTVLVLPPMASVERLPAWRYTLIRSLLFPGNRDSLGDTVARLRELRWQLQRLAEKRQLEIRDVQGSWFGLDPIHVRPLAQRRAWAELLEGWAEGADFPWPGWLPALRSCRLAPAHRRLWGRLRTCPQPHSLPDGCRVFLY